MELKKVMLAVKAKEFDTLRYPLLASTKIDGVRGTVKGEALLSRTMTPIPNRYTQSLFSHPLFAGLDGELVVGEPNHPNCMQNTMSGVMSQDGEPDVKWYVFDDWTVDKPYAHRARIAKERIQEIDDSRLIWLPQVPIYNVEQLFAYEEKCVADGYEGVILRAPDGPYKQNRSTVREGYMLKVKRFEDSEAEILDCYEMQHNDNEATIDARGHTKRATNQENKRAAGVLGGFNLRDIYTGVEFDLGTGFTAEQRKNLWEGRRYLKGKLVKYKHFPIGVVEKPRHPIFLGFRDKRDI
ncbi:MAG TPA: ATP-dependent DNA ligase [Candidatus Acidoferrales bacterium]|nr:ATP-dependent DNA ligase [Candidatus Acidoferrales bacterium]